ncbi:TNF receptor-associated factor 6-like isoform X4 [Amblyomma americanum]
MGADVDYRDLPGGTRKVRFADELPRRVMCSTCGMLSMEMYQDEQGHAFCNVCVAMQSPAAAIFCKYEDRDIPLDKLYEAFEIFEIIKDQVVFCPNEELGCTAYFAFRTIEDHFLKCEKTKLFCTQCQHHIKGINWKQHNTNCPRKIVQCRYCVTAFPQIDLQTHEAVCAENPNAVRPENREQSCSSSLPLVTAPNPKNYVSVDQSTPRSTQWVAPPPVVGQEVVTTH